MKIAVHLLHLGIAVALVLSLAPSAVARQHLHPPSGSADGAAHAAPHCGAVAGNAHVAADGAHTASDKNCCCGGAACDDGCVHDVSLVAARIPSHSSAVRIPSLAGVSGGRVLNRSGNASPQRCPGVSQAYFRLFNQSGSDAALGNGVAALKGVLP